MRQPNQSFPGYPRPVEVMFYRFYNRAALNVTSVLPLTFSLTHLLGMIPYWREAERLTLTEDGGLEALITIMSSIRTTDPEEINVRRLAMKCIIGFIGAQPEWIRVRTVESRIAPSLVTLLELFWRCMEVEIRERISRELMLRPVVPPVVKRRVTIGAHSPPGEFAGLQIRFPTGRYPLSRLAWDRDMLESIPVRPSAIAWTGESDADRMDMAADDDNTDGEALRSPPPEEDSAFPSIASQTQEQLARTQVSPMDIDDVYATVTREESLTTSERPSPPSTFRGIAPNAPLPTFSVPGSPSNNAPSPPFVVPVTTSPHRRMSSVPESRISSLYETPHPDDRVPKMEDIQDCLDLITTLTKHPRTREYFINTRLIPNLLYSWQKPDDAKKPINLFQMVERFTFNDFHPPNICASASSILRNYQRKTPGIPRPCGNLHCKTRESEPKKFICCSECRRTRYCSYNCLEVALDGHRHWCRNRRAHRTQVAEPLQTVDTPQVMNERETVEG